MIKLSKRGSEESRKVKNRTIWSDNSENYKGKLKRNSQKGNDDLTDCAERLEMRDANCAAGLLQKDGIRFWGQLILILSNNKSPEQQLYFYMLLTCQLAGILDLNKFEPIQQCHFGPFSKGFSWSWFSADPITGSVTFYDSLDSSLVFSDSPHWFFSRAPQGSSTCNLWEHQGSCPVPRISTQGSALRRDPRILILDLHLDLHSQQRTSVRCYTSLLKRNDEGPLEPLFSSEVQQSLLLARSLACFRVGISFSLAPPQITAFFFHDCFDFFAHFFDKSSQHFRSLFHDCHHISTCQSINFAIAPVPDTARVSRGTTPRSTLVDLHCRDSFCGGVRCR